MLVFAACTFTVEKKDGSEESAADKPTSSKIRNGIELNTKGNMNVSQAFLLYEDGSLVPHTNQAKINQTVNLRLIIDDGFKETNGKVQIGAAEKIETSNGDVLLDEKDLFANLGEVEARPTQLLTLKAVITQIDKLYDYFLVSFKVWDKNGNGEVTGSYKLYIQ